MILSLPIKFLDSKRSNYDYLVNHYFLEFICRVLSSLERTNRGAEDILPFETYLPNLEMALKRQGQLSPALLRFYVRSVAITDI